MKKLIVLCLSLFAVGGLFQACDDSKTYAEMLEEEENAVRKFIKDEGIKLISQDVFEQNDSVTNVESNEYVTLSDGVYMQIVDRGTDDVNDTFKSGDEICARFEERNLLENEVTCFNVFLEGFEDANQYYTDPAVFRYTSEGTYAYGTFIQQAYSWSIAHSSAAEVPSGWLLALPFLRNNAHVRLIVPSKMGISESQNSVIPYYYDIRSFSKAVN